MYRVVASRQNARDSHFAFGNIFPQTLSKKIGDLMRIAFLGVRVPGHLYPMTTLARKLKARGHDVVFISVLDTEPFVTAANQSSWLDHHTCMEALRFRCFAKFIPEIARSTC